MEQNRRVEELLRGDFTPDPPELLSSVEEINIDLRPGEQRGLSFDIGTAQGIRISGTVYSDSSRIAFNSSRFAGNSCNISFCVSAAGLEEGSEERGSIVVLTDAGELKIPVYIKVCDKLPEPYEKIKTLENFGKLASEDFRKAFHMFTNEGFEGLLRGKNRKYIPLYKGLSQNPVTYQHLEEFLIATGRKEKVCISTDKQGKLSYVLNSSQKDTLYIFKSTWGYTRIEVETVGDFIDIEKKIVTSDDFIGRVYGLEYVINREKLRGRKRSGSIILKTVYGKEELFIEASPYENMEEIPGSFQKRNIIKLAKAFMALNLRRMDYRTWYSESRCILDEIKAESCDSLTLLTEGYLAYCQEEIASLAKLIWPIKTGEIRLNDPREKALYLFLAREAGLLPSEKQNIAPILYAYLRQKPSDYFILGLYLDELKRGDYESTRALAEMEKAYEMGCNSPFLYLRAWKILSAQESLLRKLTPFMIRVIYFAQRYGLINESIVMRTAFLAPNVKGFSRTLYRFLVQNYKKYGSRELLEAICRHIMNDDPANRSYHKWYAEAVDKNIRLTRLYEYYIETRPETLDEPLPAPVKLYFSYTSTISERRKAFLYASIINDKENDPLAYENCAPAARSFALMSIKKGRINEFYAVLYNEFFANCEDAETAGYLSGVLFCQKLVCHDANIRRVIVCHTALNDMQSYALSDGTAYPKIYGDDVRILFEDDKKRRFAATVDYELKPLMDTERLAKTCMKFGVWDTGMQLYCCREQTWKTEISRHNLMSFWKAAENVYFTGEYRDRIRRKLLSYMDENADNADIIPYVGSMKELTYGRIDKRKTFELLMNCGAYEKALNLVRSTGFENVNVRSLMKLAVYRIRQTGGRCNDDTLAMAEYVYREGLYNGDILRFIGRYGIFDVSEYEVLIRRMNDFGEDTYYIEEKYLLISMLTVQTTHRSADIMASYCKKAGEPKIIRAYLNFISLLYLVKDKSIGKAAAEILGRLCESDCRENAVRNAARLKYKAQCDTIIENDDIEKLKEMADYCAECGLVLDFFKKLPREITENCSLDDKIFAQESFPSGSGVVIHYRTQREGGEAGEWKSEPFKECIPGLYVRKFMLFYGESLVYYCTVSGKEAFDTEKKTIKALESSAKGRSKYCLLNRLLMYKSIGAADKADEVARQYIMQENMVEKLFKLKE